MNCLSFEEKIAQHLDGGLDRGEVRLVEEHLRSCPACAEFADKLEFDRIALRTPPPESSEVDFAALRRQIRRGIVQDRRRRRLVPALLIAASILVAVGIAAIRLGSGRVPPQRPQTAQVKESLAGQPAPPAVMVGQALSPARGAHDRAFSALRPKPVRPPKATVCPIQTPGTGQEACPTAPIPRADPALEAALREFVAAEEAPAISPEPSPIEIRIVTGDPNVILILLQGTNGVSNE